MARRVSLPAADELFRATGDPAEQVAAPDAAPAEPAATGSARPLQVARPAPGPGPTGRERHAEKITVYCSPEELVNLEQARLNLRADHGIAVDRGRIVREALGVVLADLRAKGESSILVRRLRGD